VKERGVEFHAAGDHDAPRSRSTVADSRWSERWDRVPLSAEAPRRRGGPVLPKRRGREGGLSRRSAAGAKRMTARCGSVSARTTSRRCVGHQRERAAVTPPLTVSARCASKIDLRALAGEDPRRPRPPVRRRQSRCPLRYITAVGSRSRCCGAEPRGCSDDAQTGLFTVAVFQDRPGEGTRGPEAAGFGSTERPFSRRSPTPPWP
jgi:hypothetical protein